VKTVDLRKVYRIKSAGKTEDVVAIDDVNLEVFRGETFGIIGESGSGKTTLGKAIIRLVEPSGGEIYFDGTNLSGLNPGEMRKLRNRFQIVFQDPYKSLNPRISVGNSVAEGITGSLSRKDRTGKAKKLLETVGIDSRKYDSFPHQFSGGERQRIAIARALSTDPEFIVCDEPTSNLDLSIQAKILNLFMELKDRLNLTYLFISHNLQIVKFISDRVAVMHGGRIVEEGETSRIITNPEHPYTKTLISRA